MLSQSDRVVKTIFKPRWHGRPIKFGHHALGYSARGKYGRYELQN